VEKCGEVVRKLRNIPYKRPDPVLFNYNHAIALDRTASGASRPQKLSLAIHRKKEKNAQNTKTEKSLTSVQCLKGKLFLSIAAAHQQRARVTKGRTARKKARRGRG